MKRFWISLFFIPFLTLTAVAGEPLVVMSYNLENFFDAVDNPQTDDEAYLPLKHKGKNKCQKVKNPYYRKSCFKTDWTEEKIKIKKTQHLKVLKDFPEKLSLLALIEIENETIAKLFQNELPLKGLAMSTGKDKRGINVALLYDLERFTFKEKREHPLSFETRNILEVELLDKKTGNTLYVFVNHWPSQRSKTPKRLQAAALVEQRLAKIQTLGKKISTLALGDFNTLESERPHPFDLLLKFLKDSSEGSSEASYFYKRTMSWNLLDRIFYSKDLKLEKFASFRPSYSQNVVEYTNKKSPFWGSRIVGAPKGYDHNKVKKPGYSDHYPVWAKFSAVNGKK